MSRILAFLDFPALAHDDYAIGHLGDHAHIVGNKNDGSIELRFQCANQVENLGLDRDVEGGSRLVRNQDLRLARERHSDHHSLPHTARELMRILNETPLWVGDTHVCQHLERVLRGLLFTDAPMCDQHFGELPAKW